MSFFRTVSRPANFVILRKYLSGQSCLFRAVIVDIFQLLNRWFKIFFVLTCRKLPLTTFRVVTMQIMDQGTARGRLANLYAIWWKTVHDVNWNAPPEPDTYWEQSGDATNLTKETLAKTSTLKSVVGSKRLVSWEGLLELIQVLVDDSQVAWHEPEGTSLNSASRRS